MLSCPCASPALEEEEQGILLDLDPESLHGGVGTADDLVNQLELAVFLGVHWWGYNDSGAQRG